MNRRELNLLNMLKSVDLLLTNNAAIIANHEATIASHNRIKGYIDTILQLGQTQAIDTKVPSKLKSLEKDRLDANLTHVTAALHAYAITIGDVKLQVLSNLSKTEIKRMREADYYIKVKEIYQLATPVAAELSPWGISPADVAALDTLSTSIFNRTPDIRNVKVVTKQASEEIRQAIVNANNELKTVLDPLIKPFESINPTFYGQYKNARKLVELAATQKEKEVEEAAS